MARLAAEYQRHRAYIASREQHYTRTHNVRTLVDLWYANLPHNAPRVYCQHVNTQHHYTYQHADHLSNQIAHHFATATTLLSPDSLDPRHSRRVVALLMENCPTFLVTWLALAKLGCTIALINTSVSGLQLVSAVRVAGARVVVVSKKMRKVWRAAEADMTVGERQQLAVHYSLGLERETTRDDSTSPTETVASRTAASTSSASSFSFPASSVASPSTSSVFRTLHRSPHTSTDSDSDEDDTTYYDDDLSAYPTTPYADAAALRAHLHLDDPVFYIFTSGTTGASKAAYFSHRRFMGAGITWTYPMSLVADDVYYVTLPLFHGNGGVVAVSACWNVGARLIIREKLSVREFWKDVRRYSVTAMIYIGEVWRYIHSAPRRADDADNTLRIIAGNGLRADIWTDIVKRFGIDTVVEHFGCTEMPAGPYIAWMGMVGACGYIPPALRKQQGADKLIAFDVEQGCVTRGEPSEQGLPGPCVEVPVDVAGECIFKLAPPLPSAAAAADGASFDSDNPHVPADTLQRSSDVNPLYKPYHGYTDTAANGKRVYRHVFGAHDAYFSTGDLMRVDGEGFFFFVDRTGDTFRWKGENVSTNEVAEAVSGFAPFAQVNVYGVQYTGRDGKAGMASVRLVDGLSEDGVDWAELFSHLYAALPHYAIPIFVRVTAAIAETSTSKYQKYRAVQEGFDVSRVGGDAVYTLDGKGCTYRRLTEHRYAEVTTSTYRGYELSK